MVSFMSRECGSETVFKRRRTCEVFPPTDVLTPVQQRQTTRCRKQTLMSRLSDSGFEEDLGPSPIPSSVRIDVVPPFLSDQLPAGHLSTWYLQYGDIGYNIQKEKEAQFHPCESLARQPQLTAEARCTLVSWLIPVHKHFGLSFECLCLAVNLMDRFLASTPVAADCFQLLGVTALLLASKEVEVCSPRVSHLLSFCCDAFTKEQLYNLECLILLRLDFRLAAPTLAFFLDYYINVIKAAQFVSENKGGDGFSRMHTDSTTLRRCSNFARKVCELSLADYAFNKYPPSLIASCALRLASDLTKTKQAFVEHATIPSPENQWGGFVDELCPHPGSAQASTSPKCSEGDSLASVMDHLLSVRLGSCNRSLAQECKDNLKLLVSLNKETLEMISTM